MTTYGPWKYAPRWLKVGFLALGVPAFFLVLLRFTGDDGLLYLSAFGVFGLFCAAFAFYSLKAVWDGKANG